MSENELDARVAQLYRGVSAGLPQDHLTSVWARFEMRAPTDDEAIALVRDQLHTGAAALRGPSEAISAETEHQLLRGSGAS